MHENKKPVDAKEQAQETKKLKSIKAALPPLPPEWRQIPSKSQAGSYWFTFAIGTSQGTWPFYPPSPDDDKEQVQETKQIKISEGEHDADQDHKKHDTDAKSGKFLECAHTSAATARCI